MGLGFDHGHANWSYSGFMRFRRYLAHSIGIDLKEMDGYGSGSRRWDTVQDDIVPLFCHSDCDGELTPEECAKIAPRLRELVEAWDETYVICQSELRYDKDNGRALADAMEECVEKGEALGFC